MKKRFRLRYEPHCLVRYIIADDIASALTFAKEHNTRGISLHGEVLLWGEIEEIMLWTSKIDESQIAQNDEVAA